MSADSWSRILASEKIAFTPGHHPQSEEAEVKLRVICVGLPRTGTTSLAAALKILGFGPVLHDHGGQVEEFIRLVNAKTTQLENQAYPEGKPQTKVVASDAKSPEDAIRAKAQKKVLASEAKSPEDAIRAKAQKKVLASDAKSPEDAIRAKAPKNLKLLETRSGVSLTSVTNGYTATLDCPTMDFYQELMSLHPNALVILTTRDSASAWWKSYYETMGYLVDPGWKGCLWRIFIWPIRENTHELGEAVTRLWRVKYGGWGPGIYYMHERDVKGFVPEKKLLIWNAKDGWPQLCKFLGVKIPRKEFPKLNDTKTMCASVGKNYRKAVAFWMGIFAAICFLLCLDFISDGLMFDWWNWLRTFFESDREYDPGTTWPWVNMFFRI